MSLAFDASCSPLPDSCLPYLMSREEVDSAMQAVPRLFSVRLSQIAMGPAKHTTLASGHGSYNPLALQDLS